MISLEAPTDNQIIALTRHVRDEHAEIWRIYQRIGFREYPSIEELIHIHEILPSISAKLWNNSNADIHQDKFISLGLLARLADGLLTDSDLDGKWVAEFIEDRRQVTPSLKNGRRSSGGWKPIELGWIMALAREVDSDPKYWSYFTSLSKQQHENARLRPYPDIVYWKKCQFRDKHCLMNRETSLGIFPLLYAKKEGKISSITDIEQVKAVLGREHRTQPSILGGFNLDCYFEDLNR